VFWGTTALAPSYTVLATVAAVIVGSPILEPAQVTPSADAL
jgi:hypothetical protein